MSLQVWLPLIKDLNNYGLANVTVTSNAVTQSITEGKLGSSYSFNGSTSWIKTTMPSTMKSLKNSSVCMWIKSTASVGAGGGIMHNDTNAYACMCLYTSGWQMASGSAWKYVSTGTFANTSVWHHIACTMDDTKIKTYLDGVLVTDTTIAAQSVLTDITDKNFIGLGCDFPGGDEYFTGFINDFRVYDHCLSPKEVKEISKGLVCHYPLDNNGSGMTNLVNNSNTTTATVFQYHEQTGGSSNSIEMDGGIPCVKIKRNSTAHSGWAYLAYEQLRKTELKTSTTYTISFDVKASGSGSIGMTGFVNGNATNYMTNSTKVIQGSFTANQWSHIILQATTIASFADITVSGQVVYMSCGFLNTVNVWMLMKNFRVTEGSNESPWSPSVSDASYSIFNINGNKEIDISGYKHDGLFTTKASVTSDTPRYTCSYIFNGVVNNAIINSTTDFNYTDNFSWACWIKTNYTGTTAQYAWTVGRADAGGYGYGLRCASATICDIRFGNKSYSVAVTGGSWTHLAFTKNGTAIKIYKNGELVNSYTFDGTLPTYSDGDGVGIGCFHYASGNIYPYYGSISDFRIYATALSADDIKQLYQSSISVDNNGNVFCSDIQEV